MYDFPTISDGDLHSLYGKFALLFTGVRYTRQRLS